MFECFFEKARVGYLLMRISSYIAVGLIFLSMIAFDARADEIFLANGDRISGEILYIVPGEIQIQTEYAGSIGIDFSRVENLSTDRSGQIHLKDGKTITGVIESFSGGQVSIRSESGGTVIVPRDAFAGFERAKLMETPVPAPETDRFPPRLDIISSRMAPEKEKEWSGSVALGTILTQGNSDSLDIHFETTATRKRPRDELRLRFLANYGESDGDTNQNSAYAEVKMKTFPSTRWYLFGVANTEHDEMQDLRLRAQVFGGPGYNFIDKENVHLLGETGLGLTGASYRGDGGQDTLEPTMWLNTEWKQRLFERMEFSQGLTLFPSLGDLGDYRVRSTTALTTLIGNHWGVKLSAIDDYNSNPQTEDVERNDLRVFSSLEYKF